MHEGSVNTLKPAVDPLNAARSRGGQRLLALQAREDMRSGMELAILMKVSPEEVEDLWQAHKVLGIIGTNGDLRFPRWQVQPDGTLLDGLAEALAILNDNGLTALRILSSAFPDGTDTMIYQALRDGKKEVVLRHLQGIANGNG